MNAKEFRKMTVEELADKVPAFKEELEHMRCLRLRQHPYIPNTYFKGWADQLMQGDLPLRKYARLSKRLTKFTKKYDESDGYTRIRHEGAGTRTEEKEIYLVDKGETVHVPAQKARNLEKLGLVKIEA